jgi:hypothetical protein
MEAMNRLKELMMRKIRIRKSYQAIFATDEGKDVLRHIMSQGFITRSTFVVNDPQQTALNEGSRRLALSILRFAIMDHESIIEEMERELQHEDIT